MVKISKQRRKYSKCHTLKIVFLTIAASIGISFLVMSWLDSLFSIWRQGIHSESTLRRGMHEKDEGYRNNQGQRSSPVNEVNWDLDDVVDTNDHSTIMKHYRKLRVEHESKHPLSDSERMKDFVKSVRNDPYEPIFTKEDDEIDYDVFNCPEHPPNDYPKEWNVLEVIQNWNPDDPDPPQKPHIYQGLCVFQHSTEYQKALNYRNAEKPFIIRDDPLVLETVERWHQPDYLTTLLGGQTLHRTEYSHNNHFMYWKMNHKKKNGDWKPPTENIQMSYTQWLKNAKEMEKESNYEKNEDHWYFRLNSCQKGRSCNIEQTDYLFHEVPFLKPKKSIYIVDEDDTRGINCRFGMKGNIAENHFDSSRNMIAIFKGERRYVLSHPKNCKNLCLYERNHPSGRHSAVDWSEPDLDEFPAFRHATVNEIVLQAGDVLYLPTFWFHYIISLNTNYQCNGRSGATKDYAASIRQCGFM